MAAAWAILLDLDDTLVLTSEIEPLRRMRAWARVYQSLAQTALPPGTRDFVEVARQTGRLGVVTTSPRPYAQRLLAHHGLDIPVLVAYHDLTHRKPHPEPILKAAESLSVSPNNAIYIGDLIDDIRAASNAGAIPIGLSWDGSLSDHDDIALAYAICANWDEVQGAIAEIIKSPGVQDGF